MRCALVALFLSYYGGATLFPHTHYLATGKVTHSHPYIPSGNHSHTTAVYQLIAGLSHLAFLAGGLFFLAVLTGVEFLFKVPTVERIVLYFSPHCPLRAPPTC